MKAHQNGHTWGATSHEPPGPYFERISRTLVCTSQAEPHSSTPAAQNTPGRWGGRPPWGQASGQSDLSPFPEGRLSSRHRTKGQGAAGRCQRSAGQPQIRKRKFNHSAPRPGTANCVSGGGTRNGKRRHSTARQTYTLQPRREGPPTPRPRRLHWLGEVSELQELKRRNARTIKLKIKRL